MWKITGLFGAIALTSYSSMKLVDTKAEAALNEIEQDQVAHQNHIDNVIELKSPQKSSLDKKVTAIKNEIASPDAIGGEPSLSPEEMQFLFDNDFTVLPSAEGTFLQLTNNALILNFKTAPDTETDFKVIAQTGRDLIRTWIENTAPSNKPAALEVN